MKDHLNGRHHPVDDSSRQAGYAVPEPYPDWADPWEHGRGRRGAGRHVRARPGDDWDDQPASGADPYGDGDGPVADDDSVYGDAAYPGEELDELYDPTPPGAALPGGPALDWYEDKEPAPGRARPDRRRAASRQRRSPSRGRAARRKTTTLLNTSTMTIFAVIGVGAAALTVLAVTGRLLTTRQLFFMTHASLGILITHAFGGGLGTLCTIRETRLKEFVRKVSTVGMAVIAWLACIVGTFGGYAGYRATPPAGSGSLQLYPREYLLATPRLSFWETFGMEWKVHVGWITPFLATAVAFVVLRYGRRLVRDLQVRRMMTNLFIIAFAAAVVASILGAVVNTVAPNDFMHRGWDP